MKTNYFSNCTSLDEVKKLYKKLALQYHPDRHGGKVVITQRINQEYESITKDPRFKFQEQDEAVRDDYVKFPEIIGQIIHLDITIEICGNWKCYLAIPNVTANSLKRLDSSIHPGNKCGNGDKVVGQATTISHGILKL